MQQGDLFDRPRDAAPKTTPFDLPDAELTLTDGFLRPADARAAYTALVDDIDWEQESYVMFGREVPSPRLTAWYGDPGTAYTYSGIRHEAIEWTPLLADLRERVGRATGAGFNSVLLNYYRDGQDSVSWHSDDERDLGPRPTIASVSLGAPRVFQLRHKEREDLPRVDVELRPGSLLVMGGDCQQFWKHQIPKRRGVLGGRVNLTFRQVIGQALG